MKPQKNLQDQRGFTMEPWVLYSSGCGCWHWVYFCMKATWHAASLMKFVLSIISSLQGCCHPRGSEQQGLFASTPTGNNKQHPWAPAPARSRKATSSLQIQQQMMRTSRAQLTPHLGAPNFIKAENKFRILSSRKSPQSCKTSCFRCQRSFPARSPKAAPAALSASPREHLP